MVYDNLHTPVHWGWLGPATIYHDPDETFWEFDPEVVRMHLDAGGLSRTASSLTCRSKQRPRLP